MIRFTVIFANITGTKFDLCVQQLVLQRKFLTSGYVPHSNGLIPNLQTGAWHKIKVF